ncbi:NF-kappa-B inhibitor zeta isoform X2 [Engraulis encrasicolus]|uniref:NF-kappa-B inhibitor zeta isoform X2 n=1 Tax=Engraulis encrasicolus TaxID=184585 RepID=UPI002FCF79B4
MILYDYSGLYEQQNNDINIQVHSFYPQVPTQTLDRRRVLNEGLEKMPRKIGYTDGFGARDHGYKGVRVKNTVKELIKQQRVEGPQCQFLPGQEAGSEYPVLTSILQVRKRPSVDSFNHIQAKRLCTSNHNIPSLQKEVQAYDENPALPEFMTSRLHRATLFTGTVTVQDRGPHPSTLPNLNLNTQTMATFSSSDSLFAPCSQPQMFGMASSSSPKIFHSQSQIRNSSSVTQGSFLQWQIQQEEEKLADLTSDQLILQDGDGDTYLHIAVAQGRRAFAYVLAKKMAVMGVLDMKEHNNQSALQVSVAANHHLITQDLLGLGAQMDTVDCWGRSPLHVCAEKGHIHTLKVIQEYMQSYSHQMDVDNKNYDGLTPLHIAVLSHNATIQDLLNHVGPVSLETMQLEQRRRQLKDCIQTLMDMGASCGTQDTKSGRSALHMAAEQANVELLRLFLDQPQYLSFVNLKAYNGNTALHMASSLSGRVTQVEAVRMLMRKGADPSAKNLENEQPLQLVPEGEMGEQVRSILKGRNAWTVPL